MTKIIILFALVCMTIAAAQDIRFARNLPMNKGIRSGGGFADANQWSSQLCKNASLAAAFLSRTRQMIDTLQANHSYDRVFEKHTQGVAYLKSTTHGNILSSNCTEYFNGYKNARKLDRKAEEEVANSEANVDRLFRNILSTLVGARNLYDTDF